MSDRLRSKRAIITAAGAGIGRAIAKRFVDEGASVLATDIDEGALSSIKEELGCDISVLDVTDRDAVQTLGEVEQHCDVLVNVAGWVHHGTLLDCDNDAWERSLTLNVTSAYEMCRTFVPTMCARHSGSIVNISSVASSVIGAANRFAYGTTKAALIGMTKSIAKDFVQEGIRCNAICPGTIETPSLHERMNATGDFETAQRAFIERQPMGRLGKAEEVAALACYLASDEAAFTTGAVHVIDGGWTA